MDLLAQMELDQKRLHVRVIAHRQAFDIEDPHSVDGSAAVRLEGRPSHRVSLDMSSADPAQPAGKSYLDTPFVAVRWISGGPWVLVEWKAWANSSEYRAAHETVLVALRENRASRNLIDARDARVVSDEDQRWLIENWIPRAVAAGRCWTAVVVPKRALAGRFPRTLTSAHALT